MRGRQKGNCGSQRYGRIPPCTRPSQTCRSTESCKSSNPRPLTAEISLMSEVDPTSEHCPICKDKECKIHLLARFDESGDEGKFGVGAFRHCAKRLWLTILASGDCQFIRYVLTSSHRSPTLFSHRHEKSRTLEQSVTA